MNDDSVPPPPIPPSSSNKKTGALSSSTTTTKITTSPPTSEPLHNPNSNSKLPPSQTSDTELLEPLEILYNTSSTLIVNKPGCLISHTSSWDTTTELPLVQRVRNQINLRVNLAHRLDRGASGCVLLSSKTEDESHTTYLRSLIETGRKTYLAWCRGTGEYVRMLSEGEVSEYKGVDGIVYQVEHDDGWFIVDRPLKNEKGNIKEAETRFRFLKGGKESFIVECQPRTGRWHQIRKHLNGLSTPILGDGTHGNTKLNRKWRKKGFREERIGLHLLKMELDGEERKIEVCARVHEDLEVMWREHVEGVMEVIEEKYFKKLI
ncbi:hypothetical protein TL16_g11166 [Triparma laevis f. inornata]|uniref:Pseudouridine synthase RsuA/RluA-like domain-containing protein n=1 Tax=Triparma laevis f. inornata TaxID=1714386 RepID=A0A9W7ESP8_9STRA|nr:hypothetical protein TL16_g11166 [Triparma laevis f. inornata]